MLQSKKPNRAFYFLKGIACIGVVLIHIHLPGIWGGVANRISAFAVPVFYMITGYYAFEENETVIKKRLLKTLKIFLYGYICYFVISFFIEMKNHSVTTWIQNCFTWRTPIQYLVFCTIDFAIPLWYLIAMVEVYLLWLLVIRFRLESFIIKLIPVFFLIYVGITMFCETRGMAWFWKMNFISQALPWFLTGYYFHSQEGKHTFNRKYKSEKVILFGMIIIGCILAVVPTLYPVKVNFSCVGYIPYAGGIFLIALKYPEICRSKLLEYIGRKLSMNIYIWHVPLDRVLTSFLIIDTSTSIFLWCRPLIVIVISAIVAFVIEHISSKIKVKP